MGHTSMFVRPVLIFLFPSADNATLEIYHGYVRKAAHFTEYAVLALFAVRAFGRSATDFLRRYRFVFALGVVMAIACIDEINQSFEPSRTGSFRDVLLDVNGGATTITLLILLRYQPRADQQ